MECAIVGRYGTAASPVPAPAGLRILTTTSLQAGHRVPSATVPAGFNPAGLAAPAIRIQNQTRASGMPMRSTRSHGRSVRERTPKSISRQFQSPDNVPEKHLLRLGKMLEEQANRNSLHPGWPCGEIRPSTTCRQSPRSILSGLVAGNARPVPAVREPAAPEFRPKAKGLKGIGFARGRCSPRFQVPSPLLPRFGKPPLVV